LTIAACLSFHHESGRVPITFMPSMTHRTGASLRACTGGARQVGVR
jgi:hypothetical protein